MPEPPPYAADEKLLRKIRKFSLLLLLIAVLLAVWGEVGRLRTRDALESQAAAAAVLTVATVHPRPGPNGEELVLPGSVVAYTEAPIYARTSGYLKVWYTDIGTPVRRGQLLARIETPEVDQQLAQALADLASAHANFAIAESTDRRWQRLLATDSVSRQDADQKAADAAAARAAQQSAAANVARLRELESFKRVVAPFDGVVTARNTDVGALINAGESAGNELFRVANTRELRIYVQVPEAYAAAARPGVPAELHFAEHPGKVYRALTVRTAGALDPGSRTLRVELHLDNPQHAILPGAYTEVHFRLAADPHALRLPANTLLFRAAGLQVATVDRHDRIRLKSIVEGRDFGSTIEILSGVDAADAVILNPPDSSVDGETVRIAPEPAATQERRRPT